MEPIKHRWYESGPQWSLGPRKGFRQPKTSKHARQQWQRKRK